MIVKASSPAANKGAGLDCDGKKRRVRTVGVAGGGDPPGVTEGDAGRDFAAGGERTGRTMVGTRCTSHVDSGHEPSLLAGGAATPGGGGTHPGRGMGLQGVRRHDSSDEGVVVGASREDTLGGSTEAGTVVRTAFRGRRSGADL
jgi:hypothetical protein